MSDQGQHTIAGGWLGTYYYRGLQTGRTAVRFEATFTISATGGFHGVILDDGGGGESTAAGQQTGRTIVFTKTYIGPRRGYMLPVEYEGQMTEDGKAIHGTWRIRLAGGLWEARRLWHEATDSVEAITGQARSRSKELVHRL